MVKNTKKEVTKVVATAAVDSVATAAVDSAKKEVTKVVADAAFESVAVAKAVAAKKARLLVRYVKALSASDSYEKAVRKYAIDLSESLLELVESDGVFPSDVNQLKKKILNGAKDWKEYSFGGYSLTSNEDIAFRFNCYEKCRIPFHKKTWLDLQGIALSSAFNRFVKKAYNIAVKKAAVDSEYHYIILVGDTDYTSYYEVEFGKTADKFTDEDCFEISKNEWKSYVNDSKESVRVEVVREDKDFTNFETVAEGEYIRYLVVEEIENEDIDELTDSLESDGVVISRMSDSDCRKLAEKDVDESARKYGAGRLRVFVINGKECDYPRRLPSDWQLSASSGWIEFGKEEKND